MVKKRAGLRSYVRSNLPIELVKFLKRKRVLIVFIDTYLRSIESYINPKQVFKMSLQLFSTGKSLFDFVKSADYGENCIFWNKLKLEYESECTNPR